MNLCNNVQEGKGRCIPSEWEAGLFFTKLIVRDLCFHHELWLLKAYESFPAFTCMTSSRRIHKMGKEPAPFNTDSVSICLHWLTQSCQFPRSAEESHHSLSITVTVKQTGVPPSENLGQLWLNTKQTFRFVNTAVVAFSMCKRIFIAPGLQFMVIIFYNGNIQVEEVHKFFVK